MDGKPYIRSSALNFARVCPGTIKLAPRRTSDTQYTSIGTVGHKWLELMVSEGRDAADAYLDSVETGLPPGFGITLDETWDWALNRGLVLDDVEVHTEHAVIYSRDDSPYHGTGTIDLLQLADSSAVVVDWKFYNDPQMLPPLHVDLQMYAYAVGVVNARPEIERVRVYRALPYVQYAPYLDLSGPMIELARRAVDEEAKRIAENLDRFVVGAHCVSCLLSDWCEVYKERCDGAITKELKPYGGGAFESESQVLAFLIALPRAEQLLREGKLAAEEWIADTGRPVVDLASKKQWGTTPNARDQILDPLGCVGLLIRALDGDRAAALECLSTSKTAMEDALKKAGYKPKERKAFFASLREEGYMEKRELNPRFRWKRITSGGKK